MTLLLGTQVLLWALMSPDRLRHGLRSVRTAAETQVLFSAASVWQIAIKRALGRLDFGFEPETVAQAQCETALLVTADRALMNYPAPLRWFDDF
jgi:PIN domain nuclease of toxin-antitoxin system